MMGGHYSEKDANVGTSTYAQFGTSRNGCLLPPIRKENENITKKCFKNEGPGDNSFYCLFRFFFVSQFGTLLERV